MDSNEFNDITNEIYTPTENLRLGEMIYSPGFTLLDAMSAIHIGDPRMDSFLSSDKDIPESFNPQQKLSVEEITYIIDRTTALELSFYSGSHLIQSSYTSLYLHKILSLSLDFLKMQTLSLQDGPSYEWEWLGLVLRSALIASLKCTHYVWTELVKGVLYDMEDFNSDKANLSPGELYQDESVYFWLKEAIEWINKKIEAGQADTLVTGLRDRLKLRLELLSLYNPNITNCPVVTQQGEDNVSLASIHTALELIQAINSCPAPSTTAKGAFYADISKYLPNMAPLPPLDESLLQIEGTNVWEGFKPTLESMKDINKAICNQNPLEWINWTSFKSIITPENKTLPAYVRNLVLSRFITDENLIFDQHSIEWITDKLLEDTIGLPFGMVGLIGQFNRTSLTVTRHSEMSIGLAFELWSQRLAGFYVNLLTTYCHNRSRQKRNIPKSIKQFEELYEEALTFVEQSAESVKTLSPTLSSLVRQIPFVIRSFILSLNIEALLVSTELELLDSEHDWTIIYWQLRRVACIWQQELYEARSKLTALPVDQRVGFTNDLKRNAEEWMKERTKYANLIELLSSATLNSFSLHKLPESLMTQSERQARFERRLKWCMRGNIDSDGSLETDPRYTQYESDLNHLQNSAVPEETLSYYRSSVERIDELLEVDVDKVKFALSKDKRYNLLQSLRQICEVNISNFSNTSATWSNDIHPWYPNLS